MIKYVLDDPAGSEEVDSWVGLARKLDKLSESDNPSLFMFMWPNLPLQLS